MEEHQVGITEYTTATTGFNGTLKHRYEDFQVFEVDLAGRTAHMTNLDPPEPDEPVPNAQLTDASIEELVAALQEQAGPENAARLKTLLTSIQRSQQRQQKQQSTRPGPAPAGDAKAEGAAPPPAAAAAAAAAAGSSEAKPAAQDEVVLEAYLLPIKDKQTRKAVHTFLKSDPRLPPLETDTVAAASGPEAAEAAAAGAAVEAATDAVKSPCEQQMRNRQCTAEELEKKKMEESEALNIIRMRLAGHMQGLRRKRGVAAQDNRQKQHQKTLRNHRGWQTSQWLGGDDKYTKFVLLKENMDTQAALTVVGRMLRLHSHAFGFAGTKDRRGITTQFVTLFKVDPRKLAALNTRLRGIKLGNFEFCGSPLQLGQLRGNTFRILMRDVNTHDEQHIAFAVGEVRDKGFINYFGLQRFGTGNVPTHRVGAVLLRGEWKGAVDLILQGTPHEKDDIRAARDKYTKDGDAKGALDAMPTWMVAERAILQTLVKQGANSYTSALQAVPRTMRSMYMHAWQSWCWNTAASERIRRYGADKVVTGDLVLPPAAAAAAEAAGEGLEGAGAEVEGSSAAARLAAVHVVTAEEAAQGKYRTADVVLPMPGGQVQYPQHAAGWEFYCRLAAEDGIMLPGETDAEYEAAVAAVAAAAAAAGNAIAAEGAAHAAAGSDANATAADRQPAAAAAAVAKPRQHSVKEFQLSGLSGDYRRVLHVPTSLQHRVVRYSDVNQPDLLPSDLTDLAARQQQQAKQAGPEPQQHQKRPPVAEDGEKEEGQQLSKRQKTVCQLQPQHMNEAGASQQQQQQQQGNEAGAGQQQQQQGTEVGAGQQQQQPGSQPASGNPADGMDVDQAPSADIQGAAAAANGSSSFAAAAAARADGGGGAGSRQQERVGVVLEFNLSSSCYATMLIRELTKQSTSKAAHKQLSAQQPGSANGAQ